MRKHMPVATVREFLSPKHDIDAMRVYYCYQLGSTFMSLAFLETRIVSAMMMCDRIRLERVIKGDVSFWDKIVNRQELLSTSTLGNLLSILSKHPIAARDLAYLRWTVSKRNVFVHRFFDKQPWPGDLSAHGISEVCRRLLYLEHIFRRAEARIYPIFQRAELVEIVDLGNNGSLIANVGTLSGDNAWLKDLTVELVRHHAERRRGQDRHVVRQRKAPNAK